MRQMPTAFVTGADRGLGLALAYFLGSLADQGRLVMRDYQGL